MFDDDDTPAGFRDADIELAGLEALGRKATSLRKRGLCAHGWCQGQPWNRDGQITCLDCGAVFPNRQAHQDARDAALNS